MAIKLQLGAVIYDEDFRTYRKALPFDPIEDVKWAVYENGGLADVYDTSAEAKQVIKEFRDNH